MKSGQEVVVNAIGHRHFGLRGQIAELHSTFAVVMFTDTAKRPFYTSFQLEEIMAVCPDCNEPIGECTYRVFRDNNDYEVCEGCYNNEYEKCSICEEHHHDSNTITTHDIYLNESTTTCDNCAYLQLLDEFEREAAV